jgi:hypothetical protein
LEFIGKTENKIAFTISRRLENSMNVPSLLFPPGIPVVRRFHRGMHHI